VIAKYRSALLLALLSASAAACQPDSSETLVARAGDYRLTSAAAVELLGPVTQLPNRAEVVAELASLWVDYTLLADAVVRDSTFESLDVSPLVDLQLENERIQALLEQAVTADTTLTDDELRRLFEEEEAGVRLRARHILLGFPDQPTQAQRDSVRAELQGILDRVRAGESFEELARSYSQDGGSAASGGNLGEFIRGDMVRPFEDAAFALGAGEVSDIVETPFGLHIIRVDERMSPSFEEAGAVFRIQVLADRYQAAESTFVAGIEATANPRIEDGAGELMKELAEDAASRISSRASNRPLVSYEGGSFTVGEFLTFLATSPGQLRQQIIQAPVELVEEQLLLPILARRELFLAEADARGIEISQARSDSLAADIRAGLAEAADSLGVGDLRPAEGVSRQETVSNEIRALMARVVSGQAQTVPLGPLSYLLREPAEPEFFEPGYLDVVSRIEEIRGGAAAPAPVPPAPAGGDTAAGEPGSQDPPA
jgi:parvulin-like peptidyl-prolyl isomerase